MMVERIFFVDTGSVTLTGLDSGGAVACEIKEITLQKKDGKPSSKFR